MHWIILPFQRYAEFSGRSRRREYWLFQLLNIIVLTLCLVPIIGALMASFDDVYSALDEPQVAIERPQLAQIAPPAFIGLPNINQLSAGQVSVGKRSCEPFCASPSPPSRPSSRPSAAPDSPFADDNLTGFQTDSSTEDAGLNALIMGSAGFYMLIIWWLISFIPNLALTVRRLHDLGMSGWLLIPIYIGMALPLIGGLVSLGFIIAMFLPGSKGPNKYGDDPKSEANYDLVFA